MVNCGKVGRDFTVWEISEVGRRPVKLSDTVNRGMVNRGFTMYSVVIMSRYIILFAQTHSYQNSLNFDNC